MKIQSEIPVFNDNTKPLFRAQWLQILIKCSGPFMQQGHDINSTTIGQELPPAPWLIYANPSYYEDPDPFGSTTSYRVPSISQDCYYNQAQTMIPLYMHENHDNCTGLTDKDSDLKCDSQMQQACAKKKRKFLSIKDML